jgi:hypothetical protein
LAHRAVINFPGGGTRYGLGFRAVADSTNAITFANAANSVVGSVTQSGSATAYNTTSDARLKENIVDAPAATELVEAMQVRSFNFKGVEGSEVQHGFIAQELQTVAPVAVSVGDDGEEITQAWGVDYSKLVPILVKSLQEALSRIDALEARLSK